ncbi:MAG: class I SAM-dependent methyltransferase [Alphaproteobacteria bacterium]|jgi:SAM-dependent methyltransferase|nr:class I SAM-dependent methyltransferase [Alphaproteobacteria bacterium]MDP6589987.1 class I SAM-dependent methyltransferase [Alphaproteobacteria bacterium]MDP6819192.1 class I SAM-dependent methyltransferase [Alphaproteobacteria bacterium]
MTEPSSHDPRFHKTWHDYYSEKRITHQWLQVALLQGLEVQSVLEIGPYLGLVTAMAASAGYDVTVLDIEAQSQGIGSKRHIQADIRDIDPAEMRGFDAILCCETLEHIHWDRLDSVLKRLAAAGAPWLILSVPYEGFQFALELYFNRHRWRRRSHFRKLRFLRRFPVASDTEWEPHKWEIGYRGTSLRAFTRKLKAAGFAVQRREFTSGCRSVFLVCRNESTAPAQG